MIPRISLGPATESGTRDSTYIHQNQMVSFLCFLLRLCSARPPPRAPIQHIEIGDRLRVVKGNLDLDKDLLSLFHCSLDRIGSAAGPPAGRRPFGSDGTLRFVFPPSCSSLL
jgi:hypothetical protein